MTVGAQQDPAVVVGCDGSWESLEAVDVAVDEALQRGRDLVVLTIEDGPGRDVRQLNEWSRAAKESAHEAHAAGPERFEHRTMPLAPRSGVEFVVEDHRVASRLAMRRVALDRRAASDQVQRHLLQDRIGAAPTGTPAREGDQHAMARCRAIAARDQIA